VGRAAKAKAERRTKRLGPYTKVPRVSLPPIPETASLGGLGSDRRARGAVPGRCYLCGVDTQLERSHVLPRWAGRWAKREAEAERAARRSPRGSLYRGTPWSSVTAVAQDLYWHYMLCRACESRLSPGERLLEQVATVSPLVLQERGVLIRRNGLWYVGRSHRELIQRALIGTLVKVHYAPSCVGRMSEPQARAAAKRVLEDDYSGLKAPWGVKWYAFRSGLEPPPGNPRAWPSSGTGPAGGNMVTLGGVTWFVPTMRNDPAESLTERYEWSVVPRDLLVGATDDHLADFYSAWASLADEDSCPCGSDSRVSLCCRGTWIQPALGS